MASYLSEAWRSETNAGHTTVDWNPANIAVGRDTEKYGGRDTQGIAGGCDTGI